MDREERAPVTFTFAGRPVTARAGDTVAVALWAAGIRSQRPAAAPAPTVLYCGIGHCFQCRMTVDGVEGVRTCLVPVRTGMQVEPDPEPEGGADHAD